MTIYLIYNCCGALTAVNLSFSAQYSIIYRIRESFLTTTAARRRTVRIRSLYVVIKPHCNIIITCVHTIYRFTGVSILFRYRVPVVPITDTFITILLSISYLRKRVGTPAFETRALFDIDERTMLFL